MKKIIIAILSLILLILLITNVSAGFFDGWFSDDSSEAESNFTDMGIINNKSSDWYYYKNKLNVSVTDNGTVLSNQGEANTFYSANKPSTAMDDAEDLMDWVAPFTVEFDLVSDNGSAIQIIDESHHATRTFEQLGATSGSHVKVVNDGSYINFFIDNKTKPSYSYDKNPINNSTIRFIIQPNTSLTYKNFTIY